jgi:hypothetical protein
MFIRPTGNISSSLIDSPTAPSAQEDYVSLSADSLLYFCQSRLRDLDERIVGKMKGQEGLIGLQSKVESILAEIKSKSSGQDFDDKNKVDSVSLKIDDAIASAKASGNASLVDSLGRVKDILRSGNDGLVISSEIESMDKLLTNSIGGCRSAAEMSMIELQSLVSRRATQLQLTTGMMTSLNEGSKAIAGNIGR